MCSLILFTEKIVCNVNNTMPPYPRTIEGRLFFFVWVFLKIDPK